MQLRRTHRAAYIFTPEQLFYCTSFLVTKINLEPESIRKLKVALSLTDNDIDKEPKALSNQELEIISTFKDCPKFSRVPILRVKATATEIQKQYDSIPNMTDAPLVNQKVVELLMKLAPDEVQFLDAEVHCKDGILTNYKLLNVTRNFVGIDREKSIYSMMLPYAPDKILGFKYLTYKAGCMGTLKLARDEEYLGNLLVTEQVKQAFEKEKIKGCRFIRPEEFYRPMRPEDLVD